MKVFETMKKITTNKVIVAFLCGCAERAGKRLVAEKQRQTVNVSEPSRVDVDRKTELFVTDVYKHTFFFEKEGRPIYVEATGKKLLTESLIKRCYDVGPSLSVELLRTWGYDVVVR